MFSIDKHRSSTLDRKDSNDKKISNGSPKKPLEHNALNKRIEITPSDANSFSARKEAVSALKTKRKAKLKKNSSIPKP